MVSRLVRIDPIDTSLFREKQVHVSAMRLDLLHADYGGNKFFKLKYNLAEFSRQKKKRLITFGGAHSNHIRAVAAAGKENKIPTIGIIRGEELNAGSNSMLKFARDCGMQLIFVSRENYRRYRIDPHSAAETLQLNPEDLYILPEGGTNELAVQGTAEIASLLPDQTDVVMCAVGTGGTMAGLINGLAENPSYIKTKVIGISVLDGKSFLERIIQRYASGNNNWQLNHDYFFGGYAKSNDDLKSFCKKFSAETKIPIEPVYTGKLFYGLQDLIANDFFPKETRIVVVHSGGTNEH